MTEFVAKSVVLDIADNWTSTDWLSVRSIDFWFEGSKIANIHTADFVAYATSEFSDSYLAEFAFDTSLSKTGTFATTSWLAPKFTITDQRLICVFNSPTTFDEIRINNCHSGGGLTDRGAQNVKITTSTDAITSTVYDEVMANSSLIYDGTFDEHVASDVEDEQTLTLLAPWDGTVPLIPANLTTGGSLNLHVALALPEADLTTGGSLGDVISGIFLPLPEADLTTGGSLNLHVALALPEADLTTGGSLNLHVALALPEADLTTGGSLGGVATFTTEGAIIRYYAVLTGSPDLELPMSSFQSRRRSGEDTYLSVVVPTLDYADEITARAAGNIQVYQGYEIDGVVEQRELIIETSLDRADVYEGPINESVVLTGYTTTTYEAKAVSVSGATYRAVQDGTVRYRLARPYIFLNPGDTVTIDGTTFEIAVMSYVVDVNSQTVEIEAA